MASRKLYRRRPGAGRAAGVERNGRPRHPVHRCLVLRANCHEQGHSGHRIQRPFWGSRNPAGVGATQDSAGPIAQGGRRRQTAGHLPTITFHDHSAVGVVMAAEGYPEAPQAGAQITGVAEAAKLEGVSILHAGTTAGSSGEFTASGGRLLTVVATGDDLATARDSAYA